jgi:hypothetical protein
MIKNIKEPTDFEIKDNKLYINNELFDNDFRISVGRIVTKQLYSIMQFANIKSLTIDDKQINCKSVFMIEVFTNFINIHYKDSKLFDGRRLRDYFNKGISYKNEVTTFKDIIEEIKNEKI